MAEFFAATSAIVFGLVLRIVRQRPVAEDVLGEIYLQVWRDAWRFDPQRGRSMAWLSTIARTRAIDAVRSDRSNANDALELAERLESEAPGPEENGLAAEQRSRVLAAMRALSNSQREVIEMAYFEGYSQSQIAERLGQPLGTVKTRVRAAMNALRRDLLDLDEKEQGADSGCHEKAER